VSWERGPERPPRPESEVHVWRARLDCSGWPGASELPTADRERSERFLRPQPGRRWVASRWALRLTLAAYLGQDPHAIELEATASGKPGLQGCDPLRFSLSHSHDLAVIGVTRSREIGIDVERRTRDRDFIALARAGLDPDSAEAVRRAPVEKRSDVFYEAWVRREAVAKCSGAGLVVAPPEGPVEVGFLDLGPEWAAAVALAGAGEWPIRRFECVP
jgi:4'-phosphopantetheinyl transferase